MADEKIIKRAKKIFDTACQALDNMNWKYEKDEDRFLIGFGVNGDDIPMAFVIVVDAERQLIRCLSRLDVKFNEETSGLANIACCHFTYKLADGSFDYDFMENTVTFRITASFLDSLVSEELIKYIVSTACNTVDDYNHYFDDIANGKMTLDTLFNI